MAKTTTSEKAYNKKYYEKNKKKIIKEVQSKQKSNKKEYNKDKREYYADNPDYRKYKIKYSKEYKKREPIKSLPKNRRKALKGK